MVTTELSPRVTRSAHLDGEVGVVQILSINEEVKLLLEGGKVVTAWRLAAKLGNGSVGQVSVILDRLTDEGVLARFRAGLNNYYALPKVALTGAEPNLRAVVSDSLRSLLLSRRYRMAGIKSNI